MEYDIDIEGRGFYSLTAMTASATKWMRRVEGFNGTVAYCGDANYARDIADGALAEGLLVHVNGKPYLGDNRRAA